ncbi:MAG: hypothetical protein A3F18_07080 [Legionellales bacterium RIFCSPHIGHO2_12_FULL_37_14]|nr:MAG: hypothetical protein A3F18_07080 [Legionellales bacterium RIFCSPHIGHO2_12_FULL_37_14]
MPNIYEHIKLLLALQTHLDACIPDALAPYCFVANFSQGCLTIGVSDANWIMPLRYELPNIRDYLRQKAKVVSLTSIQLKVQPKLLMLNKKGVVTNKKLGSITAVNSLRKIHKIIEDANLKPITTKGK